MCLWWPLEIQADLGVTLGQAAPNGIAGPQSTANFTALHPARPNSFSPLEQLQHISSMLQHQPFSTEELRLNDYNNGRGKLPPNPLVGQQPFIEPAGSTKVLTRLHLSKWPAIFDKASFGSPSGRPPLPVLSRATVTFVLGEQDPECFVVHENVVEPHSEFVRLALNRDWKEAKERIIKLPDVEPNVFEMYHCWLYHIQPCRNSYTTSYTTLVKAYCLGERLIDINFKDVVIDSIVQELKMTSAFDLGLVQLVYENTPEKSPLRRLLCDIYIWVSSPRPNPSLRHMTLHKPMAAF